MEDRKTFESFIERQPESVKAEAAKVVANIPARRISFEDAGTAFDRGACGHELQGRKSS